MIDALSVDRYGNYIMSFDTAVVLGGVTVEDEDLVSFNGSTFTLFFKGSQAGAPTDLDLDAVGVDGSGKLHLSFDGSGVIDGLSFDDEDVLLYDPALDKWVLEFRGAAHHAGWIPADLGALCFSSFRKTNDQLSATTGSYASNRTPVPEGPAGTYSFVANFCNTGSKVLKGLKSSTMTLTNGNALINRDPVLLLVWAQN